MAIIYPKGLFGGHRLSKCSDAARMAWPYFFLCSNGYGRIELSVFSLLRPFLSFKKPFTEKEIEAFIGEYVANHLLFVYTVNGQVWGQWDCPSICLRKYKTSEDKKSPAPPESEYQTWISSYRTDYNGFQKFAGNFGLGVGVGVGIGEEPMSKDEPSTSLLNYGSVWYYYLQETDKKPKQNTFTTARKKQLKRRFDERVKVHEGDTAKAKLDIRNAIDALAASDFHNARGEHKGKKKFNSFEIIFRSQSQFEKWLPEGEEE